MRLPISFGGCIAVAFFLEALPHTVLGDVLSSSGFTNCDQNADIKVNSADVQFDRASGVVTFSVSGTSTKQQEVKASLVVTAYGNQVFEKDFNPCDDATKVDELCPGKNFSYATVKRLLRVRQYQRVPSLPTAHKKYPPSF